MAETPERIEDHSIIEEMQDSYLTYAMSVRGPEPRSFAVGDPVTARALPDGRDGLKPSQRRILVAMNDLNLGPRAQHRKCAKIAGDTAGNYHPHAQGAQAVEGDAGRAVTSMETDLPTSATAGRRGSPGD